MIYITGDTHSDFERFNRKIFPEQKTMTKEDYVIICGDFGGVWYMEDDNRTENYQLDWLASKNCSVLFVDGNHENHDRLDAMPVEEWHGGKVHKIRDSVIHLMRGQIYEIGGCRFFTFGGAQSHDIQDGILELDDPKLKEKKKKMNRNGSRYRVNHESWWEQELPSEAEMQEGTKNLERCGWKVDYVITHCAPTSVQNKMDKEGYQADPLTEYLEMIHEKCEYKYWFCGHYHDNVNVSEKDKVLYEQIIRI